MMRLLKSSYRSLLCILLALQNLPSAAQVRELQPVPFSPHFVFRRMTSSLLATHFKALFQAHKIFRSL